MDDGATFVVGLIVAVIIMAFSFNIGIAFGRATPLKLPPQKPKPPVREEGDEWKDGVPQDEDEE